MGANSAKAEVLERARQLFGDGFERFPEMGFVNNGCKGTDKITHARGIPIALKSNDTHGFIARHAAAVFRLDGEANEKYGFLIFCPRGLFFHEDVYVLDEPSYVCPSLTGVKEAPDAFYSLLREAICFIMEKRSTELAEIEEARSGSLRNQRR